MVEATLDGDSWLDVIVSLKRCIGLSGWGHTRSQSSISTESTALFSAPGG